MPVVLAVVQSESEMESVEVEMVSGAMWQRPRKGCCLFVMEASRELSIRSRMAVNWMARWDEESELVRW